MESYKKIIRLSNSLYNDGLEKAKVRDLSGAVVSLRKSLNFYKANIPARNLLGLVYYEMGEVVEALSEWVLSRSLKPENNPAERYLNEIQSNRGQLNSVNQTIKKYNQTLQYCNQDSKDLAVIQLKKVLSMNPKLLKGYQLLALLYMEQGEYGLAQKQLQAAAKIDASNITTLRYMREVDAHLKDDAYVKKTKRREKEKRAAAYKNGNEIIIQPTNIRDNSAAVTIFNLLIGVVIGVLITCFLVIPSIRQQSVSEARKAELEANDSRTTQDQEIKDLESQIEALNGQIGDMEKEEKDTEKTVENYEQFVAAYAAYAQQNIQGAGDLLANVDANLLGAQAKAAYNALNGQVDEQYIGAVYEQAESDYEARKYPEAVEGLEKVVQAEEDYDDGYAIYHLAQSYYETGDMENAKKYFERMVELHPGTQRAARSSQYLSQIQAGTP